jgi:hypothetical protein
MTRRWRCRPESVAGLLAGAQRMGAKLEGEEGGGKLSVPTPLGPLEGTYAFDGELFIVAVTARPAMLPVEMIWSRLDAILGAPVVTA